MSKPEYHEELCDLEEALESTPWTAHRVDRLAIELTFLRDALWNAWVNGYGEMFGQYFWQRYELQKIEQGYASFWYEGYWHGDRETETVDMPLSVLYDPSWRQKELDRRENEKRKKEEEERAKAAQNALRLEQQERTVLAALLAKYGKPENHDG